MAGSSERSVLHNSMLWVCIALVSIGIWVNLTGYSPTFFPSEKTGFEFEVVRYVYGFGRVLIAVAFLLLYPFFERAIRTLAYSVPLFICLGTVLLGIANHQSLFTPFVLSTTGALLSGAGYMWFVATLHIMLAKTCSIKKAILTITIAQVLEQLLSIVLSHVLPEAVEVGFCVILPLLSLLGIVNALRWGKQRQQGPCLTGKARTHQIVLLLTASAAIVVVSLASTIGIWGSPRVDYTGANVEGSLLETAIACAIMCLLVYITLIKMVDEPLSTRYQIPFLALVAGLMLVGILGYTLTDELSSATRIVLVSVEFYAHILMWAMVMTGVQNLSFPAYKTLGISSIVFSSFSLLCLILMERLPAILNAIILVAAYALIVASAIHPRIVAGEKPTAESVGQMNQLIFEGEPKLPLEASGSAVAESLRRRCEIVGEEKGLSPRERDVLFLLAQGRTQGAIEKVLVLSPGTVKTHILHVYAKMEIHSRQEMIDIVFGDTDKIIAQAPRIST